MEKIEVKYFKDDIPKLQFVGGSKSNWIDLYAAEDVQLSKGDFKLIPLGVAIKLPDGYEAIIAPRSSTFKNYGIIQTNSVGIIDNSYCGDADQWMFPVYATRPTIIEKGARICQFRIIKSMGDVQLWVVEKLGDVSRGGFGSTGL